MLDQPLCEPDQTNIGTFLNNKGSDATKADSFDLVNNNIDKMGIEKSLTNVITCRINAAYTKTDYFGSNLKPQSKILITG